ncbi:hypothetical protein HPB50_017776 [Hyalomma asiaticum]|uniref:Uncharacterized protein n=1 Tax=Hyalomma asiaticum TaxID=266040 RepID=A0ACB7TJK4_HYAAI|nr:hypothetical protein HPB50_017776 [Hyalomma asiaticum]
MHRPQGQVAQRRAQASEIQLILPSHFPWRRAQGRLGRPIQLRANHFSVEIPAENVYHYDSGDLLRVPQGGQGAREGKVTKESDSFQSRYDRLTYPNLPYARTGSAIQPVYLPLEVCEIVGGQHCKRELEENQTSEMIKRARHASAKRFNEIRQSVRDLVNSSEQCLREYSVKVCQREPVRPAGQPRELQVVGTKQPLNLSVADTKRKPIHTVVPEEQPPSLRQEPGAVTP